MFLYKRLRDAGVVIRPHTWIKEIRSRAVEGFDVFSGAPAQLGDFDAVVLATGSRVVDDLYQQMKSDPRVVRVGDCLAPRKLDNAVWDGFHAVNQLPPMSRVSS
jgi:hypothetical protein